MMALVGSRSILIEEDDGESELTQSTEAVVVNFVNGNTNLESTSVTLGDILTNATVFYRNSFATNALVQPTMLNAGAASATLNLAPGNRTLAIYSVYQNAEEIIEITTPPLSTTPGFSQRRYINASEDVPFLSVAYDTNYRADPDVPHFDKRDPARTVVHH